MKPVPNPARYKRLLSPARQEQLFKWLTGDAEKKVNPLSYPAASARIKKEWGRKLSAGDCFRFYQWYPTQKGLLEARTFREKIGEFLADNPNIDLESDRVLKAGQIVFEQEAIVRRDKNLYLGLRRLRQKDLDQALARENFEVSTCDLFIKWYEDKRAVSIATMQVSHREKIALLRKAFFQDIDALQKSGKIKLPE